MYMIKKKKVEKIKKSGKDYFIDYVEEIRPTVQNKLSVLLLQIDLILDNDTENKEVEFMRLTGEYNKLNEGR